MGCGKTVMAAYIIDEVNKLNGCQVPKPLICYHYCKADAAGDSVYIFSSLILQMLNQKGGSLKREFCEWYDERKQDLQLDPTQSSDELRNFLEKSVDTLERPLYVVLDGLDECKPDTINDLINFIKNLSGKTPPVKFCLTSRYTPKQMDSLRESSCYIPMIQNAQHDETIVRHMVERTLQTLDQDLQSEIVRELAARANGSAIWIRMSVNLIEQHNDFNKKYIINLLKSEICHTELSGIYAKLFSHMTKRSNIREQTLTVALEILAVAKRPLLAQELKWAIAMQMSPPDQKKDLAQLDESASKSPIASVLSILQPFIACISDEDPAKSYVRLAHESIRELVLECSPSNWKTLSMKEKLTYMAYAPRRSELEAKLLALCVEYLMLDEIDQKDLFNPEQLGAQDLGALPFADADFSDTDSDDTDSDNTGPVYYDPVAQGFGGFFVYSSCFWTEHSRHAAVESSPHISSILALTKPKSKRFRNWYQ
ncbi:hypothetical protein F4782DRAFT_310342 [Xylaria castorea]|nr:hypothetical protein F4782DRAFT_310342 [Xylaria castorea]